MEKIPKKVENSRVVKRLRAYLTEQLSEVKHTTLNPAGPGAVRIHLVPPKEDAFFTEPCVAIVNGADIIPINFFWAVMLSELINQINVYDGREIDESDRDAIVSRTADKVSSLVKFGPFPLIRREKILEDLTTIYETLTKIAYREEVDTEIGQLSIGEYAAFMKAPHRMDVMVSAMTKDGKWHCNQKCVHCYAAGQVHSDEKELSTDEWKQILDKCRKVGIPQITFTGGEPTMREDLFELIRYARWFVSRLNTNGIRLTPDYCRSLMEADLDSVQITYYSCDPAVHNRLVGADQWVNTDAGIDNALAAGLSVSINTPLCTLNRDYVKTLERLHEKGIIYVTCSGLITTGNAVTEQSQSLQLTSDELLGILREAVAYCNENGMEIAFTSPGWIEQEVFAELGISTPTCGACLSNMAITPGGNIVPCQSWLSEEPLGNMLTDDWDKVWNGEKCIEHRNYSAEMTGECPLRRYC